MRIPSTLRLDLPVRWKVYGRGEDRAQQEDAMRITVLTVPQCPNAPLAMERITAALAGREAQVDLVKVGDQAQADRLGMNGSPTILVDGVDPFATQGTAPSLSCRLYREPEGQVSGAPGVAALSLAFEGAVGRSQLGPVDECCAGADAL